MEKIKKNLPLILVSLSSILLVIAILLLVNANTFKSSNNTNSNETNTNGSKKIDDKKDDNNVVDDPVVEPTPTPTPVPTPTPTPEPQEEKNENNVIKYFESKSNEIKKGDSKTLREKAKDTFVSVVDFIFYDKEIKGYTFKELTNTAKLKIIGIALAIDSKIDSYFPDYKESIKGTYTNIKDKLAVKYLEYTSKLCDTVGEDTCNQAKEDWANLKEKFSLTGDYLKDLGKNAGEKIKGWYENFRDK